MSRSSQTVVCDLQWYTFFDFVNVGSIICSRFVKCDMSLTVLPVVRCRPFVSFWPLKNLVDLVCM